MLFYPSRWPKPGGFPSKKKKSQNSKPASNAQEQINKDNNNKDMDDGKKRLRWYWKKVMQLQQLKVFSCC